MDYFNDIEFVICGHLPNADLWTKKRLFDGYYGIQYLHSGELNVTVGDNPPEYRSTPGVFITYPGVPFSYSSPKGTRRNHAYICFRGARVERYIASGLMECRETGIFHNITNPEEFLQTARRVIHYAGIPGEAFHSRAVLLLEELLLQIREQRDFSDTLHMRYSGELKNLRDNIAANPLKNRDFKREAAKMGLSYVYFCRLFKQFTGWAPWAFHLECRLRHAEVLLGNTGKRIQEIAHECGFNDAYHFSKLFKKRSRLSPRSFRERHSDIN